MSISKDKRSKRPKVGQLDTTEYEPGSVVEKKSDASWMQEFLTGLDLDQNVGFAVRHLLRNQFYIPTDPYKTVLHCLRSQEARAHIPPAVVYEDIEIDVVIANALEAVTLSEPKSLDAVQTLDKEARSAAAQAVAQIASLNERHEKEQ